MTTIDDNTLMRVVAMTALPDFIDIYGSITGTRNSTYKPTFVGERGFMLNVTATPLDLGVEITGDQLAICFFHTPLEISIAEAAATPIVATFAAVQARKAAIAAAPPVAATDTIELPTPVESPAPAKSTRRKKTTFED